MFPLMVMLIGLSITLEVKVYLMITQYFCYDFTNFTVLCNGDLKVLFKSLQVYIFYSPPPEFSRITSFKEHMQGSHRLEKYLNTQDCLENKIGFEKYLKNIQRP